jgi:hypothetical protein
MRQPNAIYAVASLLLMCGLFAVAVNPLRVIPLEAELKGRPVLQLQVAQLVSRCYTPIGVCILPRPQPVGTPCLCRTASGWVSGRAGR